MKQNHQRTKRSWKLFNIIGLSLVGSLVVATTASALTLDTNIVRSIPLLQKLLITQDGDLSSTAIVELSGTDAKAIKLYPSLGAERVLLAPNGNFVRSDKVTGSAFSPKSITGYSIATGTISVTILNFNIYNYIGIGILTVNDGSCAAGEVITSFVNGTATCAPAPLTSNLPSPLCSAGSFIGWSGIGVPNCLLTGGAISALSSEYWSPTPTNANDIFYGTGGGAVYTLVTGYVPGSGYSVYASVLGQYFQGYECPCDSSINSTDAACSIPALYSRPKSQKQFYLGQQSCYDIDLTNGKVTQHSMLVTDSGSNYYFNYSVAPNTVGNLPPRCGCDTSTGGECSGYGQMTSVYPTIPWSPSDAYVWSGFDVGPSCYDIKDEVLPNTSKQYEFIQYDKVFDLYSGGYVSGTLIVSGGTVNGKVGVGTDLPLVRLHVASASNGPAVISGAVAPAPASYANGDTLYAKVPHYLEDTFARGSQDPVYQCPCDVDPQNEDAQCGSNGVPNYGTTFYAPATSGYNVGVQYCVDLATNAAPPGGGAPVGRAITTGATHYPYGAAFIHRLNITFDNNVYTMKLGNWMSGSQVAAEALPLPPRCDCDQDVNSAECEYAGGSMNTSFPNISRPSMNPSPLPAGSDFQGYFAMSPPVTRSMRGTRFYDFTRTTYLGNGFYNGNTHDFSPIFNNPAPYFTGNYIGPNCIDITSSGANFNTHSGTVTWRMDRYRWAASLTGQFLSGGVGSTGTIISTGDVPTLQVDGDGMITALVDKAVLPGAGTVGALSMHYQGAIFYANGGKIGVNTDKPQAALDVIGDVRFPTLANANYPYLAIDNNGDLFVTGSLNAAASSPRQLATKAIYYNVGNVGIGVTGPAVKLHVGGNIIANRTFILSDTGLKENITPLANALTGILTLTGYTFDWIDSGESDIGFLAQQVEAVFPELVIDYTDDEGTPRKALAYFNLLAVAIQALKDIHVKMLDAGEDLLAQQNQQLQILELRISALEGGSKRDGVIPE